MMLVAVLLRRPVPSVLTAFAAVVLLTRPNVPTFPGNALSSRGLWLETAPTSVLLTAVLVSAGYFILCTVLSFLVFQRRELR